MNYINGSKLEVLVNGKSVHEYNHEGKVFVEGRRGNTYTIRISNLTSQRKKFVVSVDGLNVLTGNSIWERAYVLDAWGTMEIPGWRKDSDNVAAFNFSSVGGSYNQHNDSGDVNNVGVIGCMVYDEKPKPQPIQQYIYHHWDEYPLYNGPRKWSLADFPHNGSVGFSSSLSSMQCSVSNDNRGLISANFCATDTPVETQSLGTGWGENVEFKTQTVHYDFESNPVAKLALYYDNRKGLEMRGIDVRNYTVQKREPNPFPGTGCPPPKYVR